jgi:hypothetical protein
MSTSVKHRPKGLTGAGARAATYRRIGLDPDLPAFTSDVISPEVVELLSRPANGAALTALLSGAGVAGQVPLSAVTLGQLGQTRAFEAHEARLLSQGYLEIECLMGEGLDKPARAFPASQQHHSVVGDALNLVNRAAFGQDPKTRPLLWNHAPGFAVIETTEPDHPLAHPVPFVLCNGGIVAPSSTLDWAAAVSEAMQRSADPRSLVANLVEVGLQLKNRVPYQVVDPASFKSEPVRRIILEMAMAHESMHSLGQHGAMMGPNAWSSESATAAELTAELGAFAVMTGAGRPATALLAPKIADMAAGLSMFKRSKQQYVAAYQLFQMWASNNPPPGSPVLNEGQKEDFDFLPTPEEAEAWIQESLDRRPSQVVCSRAALR